MTQGGYTIGLMQIGDDFGGQYYFPYAIGMLQSYAVTHIHELEHFNFLPPIFRRERISTICELMEGTDAVFASCYLWNERLTMESLRRLKDRKKDVVIIAGGPQIPSRPGLLETWCRQYPWVDVAIHGEGEIPFTKALDSLGSRDWGSIPSAGFLAGDRFYATPRSDRVKNLDLIPSPYLSGAFEALLLANQGIHWCGLLESNRGCPFTCAYCYWGGGDSRHVYKKSMETVLREIDWFSRQKVEFVFCCDANFGILERDLMIVEKVAANKEKYGYPVAFSVQNTKNATQRIFQLQKILTDSGLQKGVNLALQSTNRQTLSSIYRNNISNEKYRELQQMFARSCIPTFTDMIIGLPDETYDSFTGGISDLISDGQHNRIQFINLTLLENTAMADPQYQSQHGLVLREVSIMAHHSRLDDRPEVLEKQRFVIGTRTLPVEHWKKLRLFCWMTSLLYFNKVLQIPLLLSMYTGKKPFHKLINLLLSPVGNPPVLKSLKDLFLRTADGIIAGECEYVSSPEYLNLLWPADELAFVDLCVGNKLEALSEEASEILKTAIPEHWHGALDDAVRLNMALIHFPGLRGDMEIELQYGIFDFWQNALMGKMADPSHATQRCRILCSNERQETLEEWCREVVWYGTKRGAYLYPCEVVIPDRPAVS